MERPASLTLLSPRLHCYGREEQPFLSESSKSLSVQPDLQIGGSTVGGKRQIRICLPHFGSKPEKYLKHVRASAVTHGVLRICRGTSMIQTRPWKILQ